MLRNYRDVIFSEREKLTQRREKLELNNSGLDENGKPTENWFGIALSGGGIRSATINLGFLKTLNRFGVLKNADYLSTVSGGGYTHAYIQATLKATGDFGKLFTDEHIDIMRQHGDYMIPRAGLGKVANLILLLIAFLVSWAMSLLSPAIIGGIAWYVYHIVMGLLHFSPATWGFQPDEQRLSWWAILIPGILFSIHFITNILFVFELNISKLFNKIEMALTFIGMALFAWILLSHYSGVGDVSNETLTDYAINAALLVILGFLANSNALSFHRYYRKQLSDLYLRFAGPHRNILLRQLFNTQGKEADYLAPYPLINTCLNLQNPGGDDKFKGAKASDYFLLSPLFCGSKLTGYLPTDGAFDYNNMTLPAAVTISAAAVNPGLGIYSNKMLSAFMTIVNARLGFWISNPLQIEKGTNFVWWPLYFFRELMGRIGTNNKKVNISDGGHIENLGVYELLRRNCRLIIAFDAGEDKDYIFADLNNLILRARNELGLEIRFRAGNQPEAVIRPHPSKVYSKQRMAIADIYQWWEDSKVINPTTGKEESSIVNFDTPKRLGIFVYAKSSVTAPVGKPYLSEKDDYLKYGTYKYKIYHPEFPHEPTSDQFFDEIQWESYFQLGQFIGADVLGLEGLELPPGVTQKAVTTENLFRFFDQPGTSALFDKPAEKKNSRGAEPTDDGYDMSEDGDAQASKTVQYRM